MSKYEMVKEFYLTGVWNEDKVRNAVVKGWITTSEFQEITGKPYSKK